MPDMSDGLIHVLSHSPRLPANWQPAWAKRACRGLIRVAYGGHDVRGIENMPLCGPIIVAATHRSYLDPVLMGAFLPRTLYFMGKRELFDVPVLGALIHRLGAFPIDRQGPRGSTFRTALNILKLGGALAVFPEGGIADSFDENRFKAGIGSLSSLSGAPILPVVIAGSRAVPRRPPAGLDGKRLVIRVGSLIRLPRRRGREGREAATRLTLSAVKAMTQQLENV